MKTLEINGINFEVISPRELERTQERYLDLYFAESKSLKDCYEKPSHIKELIYSEWHNWFCDEITKKCFEDMVWLGVRSYNGWMFTLGACVCMNGIDYIMEITPTHNRLIQASC